MKVFITGIEGFVGRYLASDLISHKHEVAGSYLPSEDVSHLVNPDCKLYPCDITDRESLWKILDTEKPDAIIHLAGIAFVPFSIKDPVTTWRVNLMGTLNLLEWARQMKPDTALLIVSTGEVYGPPKDETDLPFAEESTINPNNPYAASKASVELAAIQYRRIYKMPVIIARPFNHIGPGQSDSFVVSSFARQVAKISLGKSDNEVRVGNLSAARDFTDVRDVVTAYCVILESRKIGTFNICSESPVKIEKILSTLIGISGKNIRVAVDPERLRPVDVPLVFGSYEKLRDEAGWEPKIPLAKSLEDTLKWWIEQETQQ